MTVVAGYEVHPVAEIFPMFAASDLANLVNSIRENGLIHPIVLRGGKILDGRNRLLACEKLGIKPTFSYYDGGDPVKFVVALNRDRRQLTPSQLSVVGAKIKKIYEAEARTRQRGGQGGSLLPANLPEAKGDARDKAAQAVNVSGRSVSDAERVLKHGSPELVQAVESGDVRVSAAAEIANLPKDQQHELVSQGKKAVQQKAKELREAKRAPKDDSPPDPVGGDAPLAQTQPEIGEVTDGETDEDCEYDDCRHGYEFDDPEYALMAMSACIDRFMRMWPRSGEEFMADLLASCRRAEQFFGLDQEASNGTD